MATTGLDMPGLYEYTHTHTHSSKMDVCGKEKLRTNFFLFFFFHKGRNQELKRVLHYPYNYQTYPLLSAWAELAVWDQRMTDP